MKTTPFWLLIALAALPLHAMNRTTVTETRTTDGTTVVDYTEEDVWYGPGFYYGIWFDDEDDYWLWRREHRHYPPNRDYYHRDRRIYYHGGRHHGGGHGGRR